MREGFVTSVVVLIIVGILVVGLAVFAYFQLKPKEASQTAQTSTQKITASASPQQTSDETANWKTYTNQRYKFSFKYPPPWELAPDIKDAYPEENVIVLLDNYNEITISIKENITDTKEAESIVCGPPQCGGYKFEDTKIGNLIVRKPEAAALEKAEYGYATYLLSDNTLYTFFLQTDKSTQDRDIKTLDQILSTFKFD